eukprot:12296993-Ditylum_brightwellii.AAC.1
MEKYDQQLFSKSLEERLLTTPTSKKHWLALVQLAVNEFTVLNGRSPTQSTITVYFPKQQDNNSDTTPESNSMFQNSMS